MSEDKYSRLFASKAPLENLRSTLKGIPGLIHLSEVNSYAASLQKLIQKTNVKDIKVLKNQFKNYCKVNNVKAISKNT